MMSKKYILIIFIILISGGFMLSSCEKNSDPVLKNSWKFYKNNYINQDGRVIDFQRDSVTTSEGQSYAMLRAVMINDKKTFDLTYKWAKHNLKRENDRLFAWLWGEKEDGSWGILDENSASDSDIDIAFALLLAYEKWGEDRYLEDARAVIKDIWDLETKVINWQRVLVSGVAQGKDKIIDMNPSYFAPYAFRLFDKYDKERNWQELVDSSYVLLRKIITTTSSGLPPNWFYMDSDTGQITLEKEDSVKNDFSYDAIRVFIRIYLDYKYSQDKRAIDILDKIKFFMNEYPDPAGEFVFYTNFKKDGEIRDFDENIGAISTLVPIFKFYDREYAEKLYQNKVLGNYNPKGFWGDPENYYTQNLAWFGVWIYLNE